MALKKNIMMPLQLYEMTVFQKHATLNWNRVASKLPQLTNQGDWKESQFWC